MYLAADHYLKKKTKSVWNSRSRDLSVKMFAFKSIYSKIAKKIQHLKRIADLQAHPKGTHGNRTLPDPAQRDKSIFQTPAGSVLDSWKTRATPKTFNTINE